MDCVQNQFFLFHHLSQRLENQLSRQMQIYFYLLNLAHHQLHRALSQQLFQKILVFHLEKMQHLLHSSPIALELPRSFLDQCFSQVDQQLPYDHRYLAKIYTPSQASPLFEQKSSFDHKTFEIPHPVQESL